MIICYKYYMDNIRQLIIDTYRQKPKHFTQMLKRNKDVTDFVKLNAPHIGNFLEQLYYIAYGETNVCLNGNVKKLKTFAGYSFCGKTGVCQCAKDSVSKSVSCTKQLYTSEQTASINEKRKATTLLLHGVSNNGQTVSAKNAHKQTYADMHRVTEITSQIKTSKLANHGTENFNNRQKSEATCLEKYGVKNAWSLTDEKQNPLLAYLKDADKLATLFPKFSVDEISSQLNVHPHTVHRYLTEHKFREPYKSTFEQEIVFFLESLGVTNILTNKRTIIGKELDIFLPDYNLAIEYNGVYWHHDKIPHITKTYHHDKFKKCEEKGIELFTIFSDSWDSKKDIWKEKIRSKLRLNTSKIFARNTTIVELSSKDTKSILDNNHVQGYTAAQYCYGLSYNNEIVAVMTFSKKRAGIGRDRGPGAYELVRYVTTSTVIGGASKLLSYFVKTINPSIIYSYSDNQYSVGKLYNTLGFLLEKENNAGYKYYNPFVKKVYHRYNFTKHKLVSDGYDPSLTEFEIMDSRGFLRIWDCGSRTWVLTLV